MLNLRDVLCRHPKQTYKKTDTHLNDCGAAVAVTRIVESLTGRDQSEALEVLLNKPRSRRRIVSDLGKRTHPPSSNIEEFISADWPTHQFHNDIQGNEGMVDIVFSPTAIFEQRVLWFGDSFGRDCMKFLSFFFREVIFLRTRFFHDEMFSQIKPDIVVTQQVERYMSSVSPDNEATPFLLYPILKGRPYSPSVQFGKALSAVMSYPRPPYFQFIRELPAS